MPSATASHSKAILYSTGSPTGLFRTLVLVALLSTDIYLASKPLHLSSHIWIKKKKKRRGVLKSQQSI